jgi:hypothetical protein
MFVIRRSLNPVGHTGVQTDPITGVQTADSSTSTTAAGASNAQSSTTSTAAGPGQYESRAVTTLTSYGWPAQSAISGYLSC